MISTFALMATIALLPSSLGLPTASNSSNSLHARMDSGFPYGQQKVRGVNLGGWLVLEPWITPSLFEATGNDGIVDEWTFSAWQDRGQAQSALNNHWNNWITESDFAQIAAAGLNHVRIPIGFWAYDVSGGEPYIQGQADYLDRAIGWARNHGLKVLIDIHGAPGSQNGFDNSGHRGDAQWPYDSNNSLRLKNIVGQLSKKYSAGEYNGVVTSIGLLNEPAGFINDQFLSTARQFWIDGYWTGRYPYGNSDKSNLLMVIHDAFQDPPSWNGFMIGDGYENVAIDHHHYQVFSPDQVHQNWDQHIQQICGQESMLSQTQLWLIVGEWSLATTDCAKYLNGRGIGSRYEGQMGGSSYVASCNDKSGNGDNFSNEYKQFMRKFYDIQTQTFERAGQGWIYWTWKAESAADWSYQDGLSKGYIPNNPGDHQYSWDSVCG